MPDQSLAEKFGVSLPGGTTVFRQGEPGGSVYVIRAGKVRVLKESQGRQRMVTTLGPGDFFGELSLLDGAPRSASAVRASGLPGSRFAVPKGSSCIEPSRGWA